MSFQGNSEVENLPSQPLLKREDHVISHHIRACLLDGSMPLLPSFAHGCRFGLQPGATFVVTFSIVEDFRKSWSFDDFDTCPF